MAELPNHVWYACYGSNLSIDRFLYYIRGGRLQRTNDQDVVVVDKTYEGARNKATPTRWVPLELGRRLVFSGKSSHWGDGGVAFLRAEPVASLKDEPREKAWHETQKTGVSTPFPWIAYGRAYRVTREQFEDVVRQENAAAEQPDIDWEAMAGEGRCVLSAAGYEKSPYRLMLRLGEIEGEPVCTFTNPELESAAPNAPSDEYVKVIVAGLAQTLPHLGTRAIREYLLEAIPQTDPASHSALGERIEAWHRAALADFRENQAQQRASASRPTVVTLQSKSKPTYNEKGTWLRVRETTVRLGNRREFIVQLHPDDRRALGLGDNSRVILERPADRRWMAATGFVNLSHEGRTGYVEPGEIALDQKLRVAIGAPQGSYVRVHKASRSAKPGVIGWVLERTISTQAELMRVNFATFEDMEISICRLPPEIFTILGIEKGDYVRIESPKNSITLRAAELSDAQKERRKQLTKDDEDNHPEKRYYLNFTRFLDLQCCVGAGVTEDNPPIFIDRDARHVLGVEPGDSVRVTRDVVKAFWSRIYLVTVPTTIVGIQILATLKFDEMTFDNLWSLENLAQLWLLILVFVMAVLSAAAVLVELRKRIR